jgi:hypothetical protein
VIRTQIQLPDEVFAKAKKLCDAWGISLDELARRGLESMISVDAENHGNADEWQLPKPRNLGWMGLNDEEIKAEAQMTLSEEALIHFSPK